MSAVPPDKQYRVCECAANIPLNEEITELEFLWNGSAPKAGQFFLIKPKRSAVFLARPISVAAWLPEKPGAAPGRVRFIILKRGRGTEELTGIRPGEKAALSGPLGNSWAAALAPPGKKALVSGGVGIAPLASYALELQSGGGGVFDFYAGFRGRSYGLDGVKPRSLVVVSEDGSEGQKGRVTDYFSAAGYSAVFVCGPLPMLRAAAKICEAAEVPCFVSMEKHMACGTGACLGCAIKTRGGNKRCCADGPVFNARELNFDD